LSPCSLRRMLAFHARPRMEPGDAAIQTPTHRRIMGPRRNDLTRMSSRVGRRRGLDRRGRMISSVVKAGGVLLIQIDPAELRSAGGAGRTAGVAGAHAALDNTTNQVELNMRTNDRPGRKPKQVRRGPGGRGRQEQERQQSFVAGTEAARWQKLEQATRVLMPWAGRRVRARPGFIASAKQHSQMEWVRPPRSSVRRIWKRHKATLAAASSSSATPNSSTPFKGWSPANAQVQAATMSISATNLIRRRAAAEGYM